MKSKLTNIIVLWAIFLGMANCVYAQKQTTFKPDAWYIGAEGGVNVFYGDIKYGSFMPKLDYDELTLGGGILFGKQFSPLFSLKGNLHYSKLAGTKQNGSILQSFKSNSYFAALSAQLNLTQILNPSAELKRFSIWGELGVGYSFWQSLLYDRTNGDELANVHWNNNKYKSALMLPMGLNMKYYLSDAISLDLHSSIHIVNSDLLDAKEGGIKYDHYWYTGIALNYYFGNAKSRSNIIYQKKTDIELLDYSAYSPFRIKVKDTVVVDYDSINLKSIEQKGGALGCEAKIFIPEIVPDNRFYIWIDIFKQKGTASGFFRLLLPSGFYPENIDTDGVSYTRIGYDYHYDFYIRSSKDSLRIPIEIVNTGRENGNYSIVFEGRMMDEKGEVYPINEHQEFNMQDHSDEDKSFLDIGLYKGQKLEDSVKSANSQTLIETQNIIPKQNKTASNKAVETKNIIKPQALIVNDSSTVYRIQILACRKPSKQSQDFLDKHHIDQDLFLAQSDGWWRYNIYELYSETEARTVLQKVKTEHQLKDAFIVSYVNGKRHILKSPKAKFSKENKQGRINSTSSNNNNKNTPINNNKKTNKKTNVREITPIVKKEISVYRIEIAVSSAKPIPFHQLQKKVGTEKITEWTYKNNYRYTIGGFENIQVTKAFLTYVKLQFALPNAKIVETKGDVWLRVVR